MKHKILKLLLVFYYISVIDIYAQPYIYYNSFYSDTVFGGLRQISRYNISNNNDEVFLKPEEYFDPILEPFQTHLFVGIRNWISFLYDCSDTSTHYELNNFVRVQVNEMLYSSERNKLYIFSDDYANVSVFDILTGTITSELNLGKTAYYNFLMQPTRSSFFSSDYDKIYFYNVDTNNISQVWTYSLETNQITQKRNLFDLGGHTGALGYSLTFGRNGKGIITSYPVYYGNPDQDFYYKFYDFDADTSSPFIYNDGESEAYFNGNGEFTLILETYSDTLNDSLSYYHTGLVKIYNTSSGQLYKTLNVPSGGIIYNFDNYPNDIYYVLNLETEPEIYNLTKLKLNSISPSIALPYISNVPVPVTTVTINGEFFTDSSVVYYDGQAKETNYVSDSVITFQLYSSDMEITASHPVWVNNYGSTSDTLFFSVVETLPDIITPIVDCVRANQDGTYTAYFGYDNQNSEVVFIPHSYNNYFSPYPEYRGQPEIFLPGAHNYIFNVDYEEKELTWTLTENSATANYESTPCEE